MHNKSTKIKKILKKIKRSTQIIKLDGVGPVDNRPSTDKLYYFIPPQKIKKLGM